MISLQLLEETYLTGSSTPAEAPYVTGNYPNAMGLLAVYDLGWEHGREVTQNEMGESA
jgi:hypothetical protein